MDILNRMKKIPGGLLIIPMLLSSLVNTFSPGLLRIGDPTTALFTSKGTMTLIGMILFISGSQFRLSQIPMTLKRIGVLSATKLLLSWAVGFLYMAYFGMEGIFGISAVAMVATISSCNPGLYLALMHSYGDDVDCAAFGILNLIAVPIIPVMILNASSGVGIDYLHVLATLVPFLLGIFLGNVDANFQKLFASGTMILLPFLGISFGSNINLMVAARSGIAGLILTLLFFILCMVPMVSVDRILLKRPGYGAAAACSVAGMSLVVPALASTINPAYGTYTEAAVAQIAFAVVLTSLITPLITKKMAQRGNLTQSSLDLPRQ